MNELKYQNVDILLLKINFVMSKYLLYLLVQERSKIAFYQILT